MNFAKWPPPIWLPYPRDSSVKNIKETQLGILSPAPQPFPSLGPWSLTYYWYFDIFDILSLLLLLLFVLLLWVYQNFVYSKSHRWRIMPYYNHTSSTTFICVITKKNSNKKLTNKNDRTQPMKKSTSTSARPLAALIELKVELSQGELLDVHLDQSKS